MSGVLRLGNTGAGTGRSTLEASASNDQTFTLPSAGGTLLTSNTSIAGGTITLDGATVNITNGDLNVDSGTLFVDESTSRVGIGTTAPISKLGIEYTVAGLGSNGLRMVDTTNTTVTSIVTTESSYSYAGVTGHNTLIYGGRDVAICADSANSGQIKFATNGTEAMRIDNSARLLVGTSSFTGEATAVLEGSSAGNTTQAQLWLNRGSVPTVDNVLGQIVFGDNTATGRNGAMIQARADSNWAANDYPTRFQFWVTPDNGSSPSTQLTIHNTGEFRIGTDEQAAVSSDPVHTIGDVSIATVQTNLARVIVQDRVNNWIAFKGGSGTHAGTISSDGGGGVTYGSNSDYRLKENVIALTDSVARIKQLKPKRFNFISYPDKVVDGFIAHEAQEVVPNAVTGTKDEVDSEGNPVNQSMDQSKLVPLLTAALQEAITRIEALESEVSKLRSN